jgi:hypothetical protein
VHKCHDIFVQITEHEKDKDALQKRLRSALGIIIMTTMKAQTMGGVGGGTGILGTTLYPSIKTFINTNIHVVIHKM